MVNRSNL